MFVCVFVSRAPQARSIEKRQRKSNYSSIFSTMSVSDTSVVTSFHTTYWNIPTKTCCPPKRIKRRIAPSMNRSHESGERVSISDAQSRVPLLLSSVMCVPRVPIPITQYMSCCTSESIELTTTLPSIIFPRTLHHRPDVSENIEKNPFRLQEFSRIYPGAHTYNTTMTQKRRIPNRDTKIPTITGGARKRSAQIPRRQSI